MAALSTTIKIPIAGEMNYNTDHKAYEGSLEIEDIGLFADLSIDAQSPEGFVASDVLRTALAAIESLVQIGKEATCRDFLATYNDGWRQDRPPIDADAFIANLEALSV